MKEDLKQSIIKTIESIHDRIGETVIIKDWICTNGRTYDRHQTRYGKIILKIDEFSVRMSGAIATIGNKNQYIEFKTDCIQYIEKNDKALVIEINLSNTVWRRIEISEHHIS